MNIFILSLNLILIFFSAFLAYLILTLVRQKNITPQSTHENISVIVPFRNEERNLGDLLLSLGAQNYKGKFELLLINDGSTDNYKSVIEHLMETLPYSIRIIDSKYDNSIHLSGKQQALDLGVKNASYDWLAFTDADVILDKNWLSSLISQAENKRTIVFGHTSIGGKRLKLLDKYSAFQLEFLFSAAFTFNAAGFHSSCMGNNLMISRYIYNEIGGQKGIGYTITEDMKLVNKALSIGGVVESVKPFYPTVITKAPSSLKEMTHQSIRWAKGGIKNSPIILVITFLTSFQSILFLLIPLALIWKDLINTVAISSINVLLLSLFLSIFLRRTKSTSKINFFPIFFILFAIQSLLLASPMLFVKPKWKERTL